jgi:hypothetical protein
MTAGVIGAASWGRRRSSEGNLDDRQHRGHDHPYTFTVWLAGGGIRPGLTNGTSDDLAMNVAGEPVYMHDLQATVLELLGIDHQRLTCWFPGPRLPGDRRPRQAVQGVLA